MKFRCRCGALVLDQTDALPHKAHLIPDQERDAFLDAIAGVIERCGPGEDEKAAAHISVLAAFSRAARPVWQCRECGRLYLHDPQNQAREFVPADDDAPREIFRVRPPPAP